MTPFVFSRIVGFASLLLGVLMLIRDAVSVHSIPYGIAGVGLVAFGAWRLQVDARLRP